MVPDSVSGKREQCVPSDPEKKAETISWRGPLQKIWHRLGGHRYESWLFLVNFKLPLHFRQVPFFRHVVRTQVDTDNVLYRCVLHAVSEGLNLLPLKPPLHNLAPAHLLLPRNLCENLVVALCTHQPADCPRMCSPSDTEMLPADPS